MMIKYTIKKCNGLIWMEEPMGQEQHRATTRVLDILEHLASEGGAGKTLTELSVALDAPKSSLFPILHTLAQRRYVRLDRETGRYSVGISAYVLGEAYEAGRRESILRRVQELMEQVARRCEEPCQLAILDGENVLYIGKADSDQAIRMISRLGSRLPANATALGKALLSGLEDDEVRQRFSQGLPRLTDHTITDLEPLLAQLKQVRENGIAWEEEESTPHLCCVAVPLRQRGSVFAALSVSMPLFRATPEKREGVSNCLREVASEINTLAEERGISLDIL